MSDRGKNWESSDRVPWDGVDRRGQDDRRNQQACPPYYQQYYTPPIQQPSNDVKNVAQTTLTLQQIATIIVVLGSLLFSGFNIWTNLNRDIDLQRSTFSQFKEYTQKDMDTINANIKDLQNSIRSIKENDEKYNDAMNQRIQELDNSFTQLYSKVNK